MSENKSYWISAGFYSIASKVSILFFGFGGFYLLVRDLPKAQFGIWALFLTITTIIETSRNGLIQNALIKFLNSSSEADSHKIMTAAWILNLSYSLLIIGILIVVSGFVAQIFEAPEFSIVFKYYSLTLLLLVPFSQFNYLQQAKFSFSGIFWSTTTRQGLFFLIIAISHITSFKNTLISLVLFQAVSTFFGLCVAYVCAKNYLKFSWNYDKVIVNKVFQFGKYVMGTNISSLVYKSTDQLMIGYFLNATSVALYNSAIRLSNLIEYPATSVAEIVYPKSAQKYELDKDNASKYYYEKGVGLTMTITLPVVLFSILFAKTIIFIVAGSEYSESADILRITILFGLFTPFSRQFGTAMDSSGRPHINFYVLVVSVVLNIVANYIGINSLGLIGAAFGTLISYGIVGIISYLLMYKIFKVSFFNVLISMFDFYKLGFKAVVNFIKGF